MKIRRAPALFLIAVSVAMNASAGETFLEPAAAVTRVLDLADARLSLMPGVAAAKFRSHSPISDPEREAAVIEHAVTSAARLGLESSGVRALFAFQVQLASAAERQLTDQWVRSGFDASIPVPDLVRESRPRLDALTGELLEALYLARPTLEEPDFAARFAPLAESQLHAAAWSAESRADLLQALGRIRSVPLAPLARIAASGVLVVGTTGDYAPYSVESHGELTGADIDLAKTLAAGLGARAVFVRTHWNTLLDDLMAGRFDLAVGGISITPERAARASFSTAYASGGKTLISRCADAARYRSLAAVDRDGVRVIVNPGGTNQQFVAAQLHRARVIIHADNRTIFEELRMHRADVMITDDVEVELATRRYPDLCRAFPGTLTRAQKALLLPRDPALEANVDALLAPQLAAGRPAQRLAEFLAGVKVDTEPPTP